MMLRANCKINLGLDVLRRRADGYHELETVLFPVRELFDEVEVVRTPRPGVRFEAAGIAVDCAPVNNLCLRAFRLMQERYGVDGVSIRLVKRVPFGAGLGGGSSDATAVIRALDELFGLGLAEAELIGCAAALGSDTAFFVRNEPQLCTGRGERMTPFPLDLGGLTLVVVKPPEKVSTAEAYAGVRAHTPDFPLAERLARPLAAWQGTVTNDFEPSVFAAHPVIARLKAQLLDAGALYASMSGSGSAVFGLFEGEAPDLTFAPNVFVHRETIR
ncbi:4-(cytidine 5'-diphospho)-2-C-methyl-D-erythritol kinase [Alistipes sp.]|uniref:4-(cytidine 5'-diphospho)-2-C-methyl-D-erythritol kinase n=1 Tax=Alistipes sp. TaxID=1872444 RepID=UPI003AF1B5EE